MPFAATLHLGAPAAKRSRRLTLQSQSPNTLGPPDGRSANPEQDTLNADRAI